MLRKSIWRPVPPNSLTKIFPELINKDITEMAASVLEKIEELLNDKEQPDGVATLLSDISKDFLTKLALVRMEDGE